MDLFIHPDSSSLGVAAGNDSGDLIVATIQEKKQAHIVIATGASQFATLDALVLRTDIDWSVVTCFHLDEYVGIPDNHPASFRRYLHERFVARVPKLRAFHGVNGDASDPQAECVRLGKLIRAQPIDVLLLGIGENAHLAFNDPPADCTSTAPYAVVKLDDACRSQQVGEGWFENINAVPTHAISMSMTCIMSASSIIASVPDARKATAVQASVEGDISPMIPGAYLRRHRHCRLHVDVASAAKLQESTRLQLSSVV